MMKITSALLLLRNSLTFSALVCLSMNVSADFKAGGDAYKSGDYETAFKEFLPLAEGEDHRAMYALGSMYAAGHGVEMNLKESYKWFKKAAAYGRPDAQYKIGVMYDRGLGLKQNYRKALNWYGKSAKSGFGLAQYKLGLMYLAGNGVKQNPVKAYAWIKTALLRSAEDKEKVMSTLASSLSSEQRAEGDKLSGEFVQKYPPKM